MNESELRKGLDEIGQQGIPATVNLWPSIQSRLMARQNTGQATRRLKVAGALLAVVIVIVALTFVLRPQRVSVAEILSRTVQVTQNAAAPGLESYEGAIDETDAEAGFTDLATHWQIHVWVQSPAKFRMERFGESPYVSPSRIPTANMGMLSTPVSPMAADNAALSDLAVSDGIHTWQLVPGVFNAAAEYDAGDFEAPAIQDLFDRRWHSPATEFAAVQNATDIQGWINQLAPEYQNAVLDQDTIIAGRVAYTIQLTLKPTTEQQGLAPATITVWVDQATYMLLGFEWHSPTGQVQTHVAFSSLAVNVPIDPAVFRFVPPPEATSIDLRASPPVSPIEVTQAWQQIAAQWGSPPLNAPSYVPVSLVSARPELVNRLWPFVGVPPVVYQRFYTDGVHVLTIVESEMTGPILGDFSVRVGPYTGQYLEPVRMLTLYIRYRTNIGTVVRISSSDAISKDELLKIGASLQVIPNTATGTPEPTATPTITPN